MIKVQQSFIYRNLANIASLLGVLPLVLLFQEDGYRYLIPLIIFNNVMDDLDGVLAAKLDIRSRFGANLDNVCDAVAHGILVLVIGAHYGEWVLLASLVAAASIILRATSRVDPDSVASGGTPTNELMRHLLFVLLLTAIFEVAAEPYLILIMLVHTITMMVPFKLSLLIRGLAKNATQVALVNVSLLVAWLSPLAAPFVAAAFIATYLYSFVADGMAWLRTKDAKTVL
jgi:phosphatidylglycerophosphate synthase